MILNSVTFAAAAVLPLAVRRIFDAIFAFLTPDCGTYRHFQADGATVGLILFGLFAGGLVAVILSAYVRSLHADFIGMLTDLGAGTPETAKTLAQLGFDRNRRVRREFRDRVTLSRYVRCVEEEAYLAKQDVSENGTLGEETLKNETLGEETPENGTPATPPTLYVYDFATAHFYLPEENRIAAEVRFDPGRHRVRNLCLTVVALIAAYLLLIRLVPDLLQLLDNCLGLMQV